MQRFYNIKMQLYYINKEKYELFCAKYSKEVLHTHEVTGSSPVVSTKKLLETDRFLGAFLCFPNFFG